MTTNFNRERLAEGVYFSTINDPKFKHNRLSINLVVPLQQETVSQYALLSYVLRRGCQQYPDFTTLNRRLDQLYGAALSTDAGKVGGNQLITIATSFIDDRFTLKGEAMVASCAALLCSVLFEPLIEQGAFVEQEVELEKQNLIDAIEALINDKRSYAIAKCRGLMGRGHPASIRRYGTVEAVKAVTAQSLVDAYKKLLEQAQVEILFVGPGNAQPAKDAIGEAFAASKRKPTPLVAIGAMPGGALLEQTEAMEVTQSKLVLGFGLQATEDPAKLAAFRMMSALYGGTPSSKLFLNVREKLSLCYYCAARYDRATASMLVDCGVEQQNIEKAKAEILLQLEEVKQGVFAEETLENTRSLLRNALQSVEDNASGVEDWYLQRIIFGNPCPPATELAELEKVTREDIVAAARETQLDTVYLLTAKEETR